MRLPAAFLVCFFSIVLTTACNTDDCDEADCNGWPAQVIDCDAYNISDSTTCQVISNLDSTTYVDSYLGSWYLAATKSSGFGTGMSECVNYTEIESPVSFTLNTDYTWRYISKNPAVDTTLEWSAVSGIVGWLLLSSDLTYPIPQPRNQCGEFLVRDDRPVDGSLLIYRRG